MRKQTAIKHCHQILQRAIGQLFKCTRVKVDGVFSSVGHYESCTPIHFGPNYKKNSHNLTRSHFPTAKILFLPLPFFRLSGCNQIQALGCQSIDQDVKAAHALRERYAPPMQSNFRVSAVLRFQRKVCRAWLERVGRWLVGVRKKRGLFS